MQSLCNTSQILGHILTVACLRTVQDKGRSVMSLTVAIFRHDCVQGSDGKAGTGEAEARNRIILFEVTCDKQTGIDWGTFT
jgi:hypothetical protein